MRQHDLAPTALVGYTRHAFVGALGGEFVRVTLDDDLRATRTNGLWLPERLDKATPLLDGCLLEIKFARQMPHALDTLLAAFALQPAAFSKYRRAIERA